MNDALTLIWHFFNSFLSTVFSLYMFDGVSLGMFFVVCMVFSILMHYVIAVPRFSLRKGVKNYGNKSSKNSHTD